MTVLKQSIIVVEVAVSITMSWSDVLCTMSGADEDV